MLLDPVSNLGVKSSKIPSDIRSHKDPCSKSWPLDEWLWKSYMFILNLSVIHPFRHVSKLLDLSKLLLVSFFMFVSNFFNQLVNKLSDSIVVIVEP